MTLSITERRITWFRGQLGTFCPHPSRSPSEDVSLVPTLVGVDRCARFFSTKEWRQLSIHWGQIKWMTAHPSGGRQFSYKRYKRSWWELFRHWQKDLQGVKWKRTECVQYSTVCIFFKGKGIICMHIVIDLLVCYEICMAIYAYAWSVSMRIYTYLHIFTGKCIKYPWKDMWGISNNWREGVGEGGFSLCALLYLECIPNF